MNAPLPAGIEVWERGWLSCNTVLVRGRQGCALIDSGYATHAPALVQQVAAALGDATPALLVNTHLHSDHCGGNAALQAAYPQLRTLIPPGQQAQVQSWDAHALSYAPTGQQCPPFRCDGVLVLGGEVILGEQTWQVHAAPGHDPHAVLLFEPESRVLVSGDALWEHGFGVIFPELEGQAGFDAAAQSLERIEALAPRLVIPGHGRPFADVDAALERARARLAGFRVNPGRHLGHAARVLLKFKLLELERVDLQALLDWACETPYFVRMHHAHFAHQPLRAWAMAVVNELLHSGSAALVEGVVVNPG